MKPKRQPVGGMTAKEIMQRFGVSRATAYLGKVRGYVCPKYHERELEVGDFDLIESKYEDAKKVAFVSVCRLYPDISKERVADFVSEAVLRALEKSARVHAPVPYITKTAKSLARDWQKCKEAFIDDAEQEQY